LHPRSVYKSTVSTISIPRPGKPGQPVRDVPLLEWARTVLVDVLGEPASVPA